MTTSEKTRDRMLEAATPAEIDEALETLTRRGHTSRGWLADVKASGRKITRFALSYAVHGAYGESLSSYGRGFGISYSDQIEAARQLEARARGPIAGQATVASPADVRAIAREPGYSPLVGHVAPDTARGHVANALQALRTIEALEPGRVAPHDLRDLLVRLEARLARALELLDGGERDALG